MSQAGNDDRKLRTGKPVPYDEALRDLQARGRDGRSFRQLARDWAQPKSTVERWVKNWEQDTAAERDTPAPDAGQNGTPDEVTSECPVSEEPESGTRDSVPPGVPQAAHPVPPVTSPGVPLGSGTGNVIDAASKFAPPALVAGRGVPTAAARNGTASGTGGTGKPNPIARYVQQQAGQGGTPALQNGTPAPAVPSPPAAEAAQPTFQISAPAHDPGLIGRRLFGVVLLCLAGAVAYHALWMNWVYGASLGEDRILAGLGLTSDGIALAMPAAWRVMARHGAREEVRAAKLIWCLTILWAVMSTLGFAALSVERSTAGTDQAAAQYTALRKGLDRLQRERDAISETRSVAMIEQAVTAALADVPASIVRSSRGCTDATAPSSIDACKDVLQLMQAQETARHRDGLDRKLATERQALAAAPAVRNADPMPEEIARVANWAIGRISFGFVAGGVTPHDAEMLRLLLLALLPHIAGVVGGFAVTLWARRVDAPAAS